MPKVGEGKEAAKFPYTKEGVEAAKDFAQKTNQEISYPTTDARGMRETYQLGGRIPGQQGFGQRPGMRPPLPGTAASVGIYEEGGAVDKYYEKGGKVDDERKTKHKRELKEVKELAEKEWEKYDQSLDPKQGERARTLYKVLPHFEEEAKHEEKYHKLSKREKKKLIKKRKRADVTEAKIAGDKKAKKEARKTKRRRKKAVRKGEDVYESGIYHHSTPVIYKEGGPVTEKKDKKKNGVMSGHDAYMKRKYPNLYGTKHKPYPPPGTTKESKNPETGETKQVPWWSGESVDWKEYEKKYPKDKKKK